MAEAESARHFSIAKFLMAGAAFAASGALAAMPGAARGGREASDRVVFRGNVHPRLREAVDLGSADPATPLRRVIVLLRRRPGAAEELERLLRDQRDPTSPRFHRWLTPEEFGRRFGPSDADLNRALGWLQGHGIAVDRVARGRGWINVSATAAEIEEAFRPALHEYAVGGELHRANSADPSVPSSVSDVVAGIASLHDFRKRSHHVLPLFTTPFGDHYLAPADFAQIYDLTPLFRAGVDGRGRSIAIVGRTQIHLADVQNFRSRFNLPANDPATIVNGDDPGDVGGGEESEADLDVEWSGAAAPGAAVTLVVSNSTDATDGVDLSAQYIVDNNLADVMSESFGDCESDPTGNADFYAALWSQAAAQGITAVVSSGDAGPAGCQGGGDLQGSSASVSYLCSTPNDVCVGGTQFDDAGLESTYWASSSDPSSGASALGYIPESAWNESGTVEGGSGLWSSGGGASAIYSKPSWQAAPGVPSDGKRDVPDVSLTAAIHDGYLFVQGHTAAVDGRKVAGGTSISAPAMAGILALVDQQTGSRQGNVNPRLYELAAAQYSASGPEIFHDTLFGDNNVPGLAGFDCGPGFDLATGLGSVDGALLARNFASNVPPSPCVADGQTLCLNDGRFKVEIGWQATKLDPPTSGKGEAVSLTGDTGYFWFFSPNNVEVTVKVVDGRAVNGRFWVFFGALSDVQYTIRVTDSQTGEVRSYFNEEGAVASAADTSAFPLGTLSSAAAASSGTAATPGGGKPPSAPALATPCLRDATTLCLNSGRFRVRVDWEAQNLNPVQSGSGQAVVLTGDTGYFWFFSENNVELVVKVVDGRSVNGHFWFFSGSLSNVHYTIRVTDTETGLEKVYTNPQDTFGSKDDTSAF